jgi:hypothetical protein
MALPQQLDELLVALKAQRRAEQDVLDAGGAGGGRRAGEWDFES